MSVIILSGSLAREVFAENDAAGYGPVRTRDCRVEDRDANAAAIEAGIASLSEHGIIARRFFHVAQTSNPTVKRQVFGITALGQLGDRFGWQINRDCA